MKVNRKQASNTS